MHGNDAKKQSSVGHIWFMHCKTFYSLIAAITVMAKREDGETNSFIYFYKVRL
jgi:hypothetical protein